MERATIDGLMGGCARVFCQFLAINSVSCLLSWELLGGWWVSGYGWGNYTACGVNRSACNLVIRSNLVTFAYFLSTAAFMLCIVVWLHDDDQLCAFV